MNRQRVMIVIVTTIVMLVVGKLVIVHGQVQRATLEKGGQEQTGHYEVVADWPKRLTSLPGHEKWTWGAASGVFPQNPNRIYVVQHGEMPELPRPKSTPIPQFGPGLSFPVNQAPFRNAGQGAVSSSPVTPGATQGKEGIDYRSHHTVFVVDAGGNIIENENFSQWDKMIRRPHSVQINPYDPEKHVWVVDDAQSQIYKFTNDGKKLVLELGVKDEPGADGRHFNRPTAIAWLPDSTMFVADGYVNTRVAKFDKNGNFLMAWGEKGEEGKETRPGYFNGVHGIAADPIARRIYVNDRENHRIQVFDENGKFLDQWRTGNPPSHIYYIYIGVDRNLWGVDAGTGRLIKWDLKGKYQYSFGFQSDAPGAFWGPHQFGVDQEGNLYVAEVFSGRVQKFKPMKGADPAKLVGKPFSGALSK